MDWEEACKQLDIPQMASPEEIKKQYLYKVNLLHPDKTINLPEAMRKKAEEELKLVNQAYQFLTVPQNNPFSNPPKLKIEPMRIRFKDVEIGQKKSTTFQITNVGGAYTNIWINNQLATWLTVTDVKSIGSERLPLDVTIECNGIVEEGKQYSYNLLVKLENEKTHIKDEANVEVELWMKEGAEEITSDVVSSVLTQQVKQIQRGFSFGTFLGTVMAFGIGGFIGGLMLYGILSESLIGLWWFILIIYVGITLFYAIKAGIKEGKKVKVVSPWSPPPFNPTPPKPSPYPSPQVVVNTFRSTYHRPSCEWAGKISRQNRRYMTRDEARQHGFKPCKVCRP